MDVWRLSLLSAVQADRLFQGKMVMPSYNKSLDSLRSAYKGLLGRVATRRSSCIIVRLPSVQR